MKGDRWGHGRKRRTAAEGRERKESRWTAKIPGWATAWVVMLLTELRSTKFGSRFGRGTSHSLQTCLMHLGALRKKLGGSWQYKTAEQEVGTCSTGGDRPTGGDPPTSRESRWALLGTSLAVQWLGLALPLQGARVGSLVRELRSPHATWHGQKKRDGHSIGVKYDMMSYKRERT